MDDLAEKVFLQEDVPGWLYQVEQGATTIWERWDAMAPDGTIYEPDMNSYNHYAYGAVCQWLFESVAGISPSPSAPGFAEVIVDPRRFRRFRRFRPIMISARAASRPAGSATATRSPMC